MSEEKLIRKIEDDFFKVEFLFEDDYLSSISFVIKDKGSIPAIDLEDTISVSQWCNLMWSGIQRMLSRVPEKTLVIGNNLSAKVEKDDSPRSNIRCKRCDVNLVKKKPCCGSTIPIYRCPVCGVGYKINPATGKGKNLPPER